MKPIEFKQSNLTLIGGGKIKDLPVYRGGDHIVSCWKMSLKEKLSALLFGKVWLIVKSRKTQPPMKMHCERKGFE